ncbi:hypothetical protein [Stenotrophomonas lacuserhaii]|uniref:hypothetical protein n=1 Tax=Stenotrophomonas lacuserhaii TaxID=2760084 RepID=UPI0015F93234|nr:hypothetical protein [Stenotrophomonas lacuserhaii]
MTPRKPFTVSRRGLQEALSHLPMLSDFGDAQETFDVYVGASGFEERVLGIPKHLGRLRSSVAGAVLLGRYKTNQADNQRRELELIPALDSLGGKTQFFDADSPEDTRRAIVAALGEYAGPAPIRTLFDISGASSTLIFSVIAALTRLDTSVRLTIGYSCAVNYHDPGSETQNRPMDQWPISHLRETGVSDVVTNELYRGIHHDHLPGFVVALPSMYTARLQRCLSHLGVGPYSGATGHGNVYWILPMTTDEDHRWRQNAVRDAITFLMFDAPVSADINGNDLAPDVHTYCDIWDYTSCLRHVIEQIDRQEGANSSVIHMGTKIQAIGVALAALGRPEVSLVSARPGSFAAQTYSDGIGSMHRIDIDNLQMVVRLVSEIGMLDVISVDRG